jgi:translation initiation factor IF-3
VRVIDDDGSQLGIMPPAQALMIAVEKGLDLVEIAATATPPVCRIMDSGKYFYQQAKRESEARRHQRHIQVKEVKFRPKIDEHDFQFKKRNAERFLRGGNKVKCTVIFRGREMAHNEVGRRILERLAADVSDVAQLEVPPRQEGITMTQILSPKKGEGGARVVGPATSQKGERAVGRASRARESSEPEAAPEKGEKSGE